MSDFDQAMFEIYRKAKDEVGYKASIFLRMISNHGGLITARTLINAPKPSDGYTKLYELNRLDLTVEAMVLENEKWHNLFLPEELEKAKKRLKEYGYQPK